MTLVKGDLRGIARARAIASDDDNIKQNLFFCIRLQHRGDVLLQPRQAVVASEERRRRSLLSRSPALGIPPPTCARRVSFRPANDRLRYLTVQEYTAPIEAADEVQDWRMPIAADRIIVAAHTARSDI